MKTASFEPGTDVFLRGRFLERDCQLESSIPFAFERPRMPDRELKIEQLIATAWREALQTFDGKTATTVLANRKLRVLLLFLANYEAISVVEIRT